MDLSTTSALMEALFRLPRQLELPLDPGRVYPDQDGLVAHLDEDGGRVVGRMRWGFPPPPHGRAPVTNMRNTGSAFWRPWLKKPYRCLIPFTAFAENDAERKPHWFARAGGEALGAFAGVWRPWSGERLTAVEGRSRGGRAANAGRASGVSTLF